MNGDEFQIRSPKKIVVFGASKTGKSSFTQSLYENKYEEKEKEKENTIKDKDNGKNIN